MNTETDNALPSLKDKFQTISAFTRYFDSRKSIYNLPSWTKYIYNTSHDGITFHNEHSNNFSHDELNIINNFCELKNYSFSAITRKTTDPSGYGGIEIEINICK